MINNFKDGVLNELYDVRSEDFERYFHDELAKDVDRIGVSEKREQLKKLVNELFKGDENTFEKLNGLLKDFETSMFSEMAFWCRKYYKLGFCDSNMLKEETRNFINISNKVERKSFYNDYSDDFFEYIEDYKTNYLMKKKEYREIIKKVRTLKENNPKVEELVEDGKIEILSLEELKIVQELLKLENQIDIIEQKEIFRLGMKEMLTNLEDMNIIQLALK
ncbi:MAG: hypothetical protein IJE05_00495 [Clostridia bacterium]|nr:hypothetical protein [Clostridia bacterium]